VLVFTRTKHGADKVARHLERSGIPSAAIHGNKNQNARNRAIAAFKSDEPPVLGGGPTSPPAAWTSTACRTSVNFDVPTHPRNLRSPHRRTGRAGRLLAPAVSFCDREERSGLMVDREADARRRITVANDQPEYLAVEHAPAHARPHTSHAAPAHRHERRLSSLALVRRTSPCIAAHAQAARRTRGIAQASPVARSGGITPHSAPGGGATAMATGNQNRFRGNSAREGMGGHPIGASVEVIAQIKLEWEKWLVVKALVEIAPGHAVQEHATRARGRSGAAYSLILCCTATIGSIAANAVVHDRVKQPRTLFGCGQRRISPRARSASKLPRRMDRASAPPGLSVASSGRASSIRTTLRARCAADRRLDFIGSGTHAAARSIVLRTSSVASAQVGVDFQRMFSRREQRLGSASGGNVLMPVFRA